MASQTEPPQQPESGAINSSTHSAWDDSDEPTGGISHKTGQALWFVLPAMLGGLEILRLTYVDGATPHPRWYLALASLLLCGLVAISWLESRETHRLQRDLLHQNRELLALHHASLTISRELRVDKVLQQVVSEASMLIGARYGALSYGHNLPGLDAFITHGISPALRQQIGEPPEGHGILAVAIESGEELRLDNVRNDSRSVGFPPHHPPMTTLLAVPIVTRFGTAGNLYLSDKLDNRPFTDDDSKTLERFASLAAVAIDNANLHEQVQVLAISGERQRIAREMHDSLAQMLAWANTKSQAAIAHLDRGNTNEARAQIAQLAASAREAYIDVREGIFALRNATVTSTQDILAAIESYAESWQDTSGIPVKVTSDPALRTSELSPLVEIHLLRLVQEALTNVRKHAHASLVTIDITSSGQYWTIVITDNGDGFAPDHTTRDQAPHFGLAIMRERAESTGGAFNLQSSKGHGARITVTIPTLHTTQEASDIA